VFKALQILLEALSYRRSVHELPPQMDSQSNIIRQILTLRRFRSPQPKLYLDRPI
jgi:hypothetical protein